MGIMHDDGYAELGIFISIFSYVVSLSGLMTQPSFCFLPLKQIPQSSLLPTIIGKSVFQCHPESV